MGPLPEEVRRLVARVDRGLDEIRADPQAVRDGSWVRIHWLLAFGPKGDAAASRLRPFKVLLDSILRADEAVYPEPPFVIRRGKPHPRVDGAITNRQFHRDQFLGYLALVAVPRDAPMRVGGQNFRLDDLLGQSLLEVGHEGELAWTLMAYSQYLKPDFAWTNKYGERLTVGDLLSRELDHESTSCGGAHRLNALALAARNPSWRRDPSLTALWPRLEAELRSEIEAVRASQEPGGAFATGAELPEALRGSDRVVTDIYRTGHTLEWLVSALPDEELHSAWIVTAVAGLCEWLALERDRVSGSGNSSISVSWRRSNIGHAASGLARWAARIRGAAAGGAVPMQLLPQAREVPGT